LIRILNERGERLAAAESCTGGGILAELTSIPGSSSVVWGGIVSYDNEAKITLLDVDPVLLRDEGAVSAGVAKSMAWGMRNCSGADWTVAVTGIAGPDGGTAEKPVGTVWIAWCNPFGDVTATLFHFQGDRASVRRQTVQCALDGVRDLIRRMDERNELDS
jgi:PncC family amidohydrolase